MKNTILACCFLNMMLLASCTSTQIVSSWREPDKTITMSELNKVLVVALLKNETNRRKAEDQMVGYLNGKGIVSYNYLTPEFNKKDENALRDLIKADGFDGAVTLRLIDVDKENTYTPGTITTYPLNYRTFSGYYRRGWSSYSTPGYYSSTKTYTVEVNVFSIKEDKIIWTGITKTTDPDGVNKMTEEVTKAVYKQMLKEGFIAKK